MGVTIFNIPIHHNSYPFNYQPEVNHKEETMIIYNNKKKKKRVGIVDDISTILGDDLLWEILSGISVKLLMQLKCVCKRWRSLIEHPYFVDLHLTRSYTRRTLLLSCPVDNHKYFFSVDLLEGGAPISKIASPYPQPILEPINGLICFIDPSKGAVLIYNPSTREETPWIKSTMKKEEVEVEVEVEENGGVEAQHEKRVYCPWYSFGFDPTTKVHKVLCIWEIIRIQTLPETELIGFDQVCEVLTVGDNTWRRIDEVPPYKVFGNPVYVNDSIYWKSGGSVYVKGVVYWRSSNRWHTTGFPMYPPEREVIVAFDVGSEKFRVIKIPNYIVDHSGYPPERKKVFAFDVGTKKFRLVPIPNFAGLNPLTCYGFSDRFGGLLEVDGCISLFDVINDCTAKLWIFDDHKVKCSTSNWFEETITMSFDWQREQHHSFQAISGTDNMFLRPYTPTEFLSLYYYDRKRKTFRKVEITGITTKIPRTFKVYTFVESLLPIQKQARQRHPQLPQENSNYFLFFLKQLSHSIRSFWQRSSNHPPV